MLLLLQVQVHHFDEAVAKTVGERAALFAHSHG
jgi:hypothetical protein